MKMLSNRTGGFLPALIFAVIMTLGFGAQAQYGNNDYGDNYDSYDNGYNNNGYNNNGYYQDFYQELAPYGQWLHDPQYGYVWTPNEGRDFRPYYTNGYWMMTEYGNTWMSNYNWGWAPFHYGRWAQSNFYGWIWIPGNEWGPAWVNWRQGGGYYGWAPMGPGVSINISFGSGFNVPNPWWTFIPYGNIYSRSFHRYYAPRRTVNIINNTTIINNTYVDNRSRNTYVTGPRRNEVETATRQKVTVYNVGNRSRAGAPEVSGRNVNIYRPQVTSSRGNTQNAAPTGVKRLDKTAVSNTGGGRQPAVNPRNTQQATDRNTQPNSGTRLQHSNSNRQGTVERRGMQAQPIDRQVAPQRNAEVQQQRLQQQQTEQQRNVERQQLQQQNAQRQQQAVQQQQLQQQRNAEQQQRNQQLQQQQNVQRQQAAQQEQQRQQQMQQQQQRQQQQQMQQQRQQQNIQRQQPAQQPRQQVQPQRNVERAAPPAQRATTAPSGGVERSTRGR